MGLGGEMGGAKVRQHRVEGLASGVGKGVSVITRAMLTPRWRTRRRRGRVIPTPLRSDRRSPVEGVEGAEAARLGEQGVPGPTAGVEDVVVARPEAMREEALAQEQPDLLDGVELG
jgi:hypothetical protein